MAAAAPAVPAAPAAAPAVPDVCAVCRGADFVPNAHSDWQLAAHHAHGHNAPVEVSGL